MPACIKAYKSKWLLSMWDKSSFLWATKDINNSSSEGDFSEVENNDRINVYEAHSVTGVSHSATETGEQLN